MDVIRRNTDYAIRAMIIVGQSKGDAPVSTRSIAETGGIPYQLACKIMQQLHKAGLVKSRMGPSGGFMLASESSSITLQDIVEAIQGAVSMNRCIGDITFCEHRPRCAVAAKLEDLQGRVNHFLSSVSLIDLAESCNFQGSCDAGQEVD